VGVEGVKHNHGPTEWCSKCRRKWLFSEVPYIASEAEWKYVPFVTAAKMSGLYIEHELDIEYIREKENPSNITKASRRITTEFGSIRP